MDSDIIHAEADNMASYSKLELGSDDIKPEKNPAYAIPPLRVMHEGPHTM